MAQSQVPFLSLPTLPVLPQSVQESAQVQVQDYSYLVNLIKVQPNLIKDLQRTIACLNAKLEASEKDNIEDAVQGEDVIQGEVSIPEKEIPTTKDEYETKKLDCSRKP